MKKKLVAILVLTMMISLFAFPASAESFRMIRVGLTFGSNTSSTAVISSQEGFNLGYFDGESLINFSTVASSAVSMNKDIYYHIQVASYQTIDAFMSGLVTAKGQSGLFFPYLKDNFALMYGSYSTLEEANASLAQAKSFGYADAFVVSPKPSFMRVASSEQTLMVFDSDQKTGYVSSLGISATYNNKKYRGGITANSKENTGINVINILPLNEYLYGVVPLEMSYDWPVEALKAQTIAASNFVLSRLGNHEAQGFDVTTTTSDQVYGGFSAEHPSSNAAVDAVVGQELKVDNKLVLCYFHSNSGGSTANSEDVWSNPVSYLRAKDDPFSEGMKQSTWTLTLTAKEVEEALFKAGHNIGLVQDIVIDDMTNYGRVMKLKIIGSHGNVILEKEGARKVFGYTTLRSMNFTMGGGSGFQVRDRFGMLVNVPASAKIISRSGVSNGYGNYTVYNGKNYVTMERAESGFTFNGRGYGHGLGMSQWGAYNMADQGYSYEQILTFYYDGSYIEK